MLFWYPKDSVKRPESTYRVYHSKKAEIPFEFFLNNTSKGRLSGLLMIVSYTSEEIGDVIIAG